MRERTERERAERAEREKARQAERERAEQAERERAARARLAVVPDLAKQDDAVRPDQAADAKKDDDAKPDSNGKPVSTEPADHEPAAVTRADVLEYPRRTSPRKGPVRRRPRTVALIAAAAVVVAAGPVAIALSGHHSPTGPDGSPTSARNRAAAWVAQQVSRNDLVGCDITMCHALEAYGVPVGDLLVMNSGRSDLLDPQVIVSTATIRHLFGNRLDSVYAPTVIASFGTGSARVDVRAVAPNGGAAALQQDLQQRKNGRLPACREPQDYR